MHSGSKAAYELYPPGVSTPRAAWLVLTTLVMLALGITALVIVGLLADSKWLHVKNSSEVLILGPLFLLISLYLWWVFRYEARGLLRYVVLAMVMAAVLAGSVMAWVLMDKGPMP